MYFHLKSFRSGWVDVDLFQQGVSVHFWKVFPAEPVFRAGKELRFRVYLACLAVMVSQVCSVGMACSVVTVFQACSAVMVYPVGLACLVGSAFQAYLVLPVFPETGSDRYILAFRIRDNEVEGAAVLHM